MAVKQKGFSLIEVLVTLIVMAIGISGLIVVQLHAMKNVNNSQSRTVATLFAYDMAERMRANPAGAAVSTSTAGYNDIDGTESEPNPQNCSEVACSAVELAAVDAWAWNQDIKKIMPAGGLGSTGKGTVTRGAGNLYTIAVTWDEQDRNAATGARAKSVSIQVQI